MNSPPPVSNPPASPAAGQGLSALRVGIDTYLESVVYVSRDCSAGRLGGIQAQSRVLVRNGRRGIVATLNVVSGGWLPPQAAGLSEAAWQRLGAREGEPVFLSHAPPAQSASDLRAKVYGHRLDRLQYERLLNEAVSGCLSDIQLAAFVTACAAPQFDIDENIMLTQAMVAVGQRLRWPALRVVDKHCVGGLPGNRTSPIVVAIVAAAGDLIPKTSSRAITSPAGTADTMATLTEVDLDLAAMRRVVERENGCLVWGGSVGLSPADDVLIRVERPLDFDSDAQVTASVLSKKLAAGSTHVLIDIPVGPTSKVRTAAAAAALNQRLQAVAQATGLQIRTEMTDGLMPVGRGIGPALEAHDVLAVLRNAPDAPVDLRERALHLSGRVLDFDPARQGNGRRTALQLLDSGAAWAKFQAICIAQGGMREPPVALQRCELVAPRAGTVTAMDNRRLARLAKIAGAPRAAAAGLQLHVAIGATVAAGQPLLTLHADSVEELANARGYFEQQTDMICIEAPP